MVPSGSPPPVKIKTILRDICRKRNGQIKLTIVMFENSLVSSLKRPCLNYGQSVQNVSSTIDTDLSMYYIFYSFILKFTSRRLNQT